MFNLFRLLKKFVSKYANELLKQIPLIQGGSSLPERDQKKLCLIINTAEYTLNNTIPSMIRFFQDLLDEGIYHDKLDIEEPRKELASIIAKCTKTLVASLINNCEVEFNAMIKMPWSTWESLGDQSPFVGRIAEHLNSFAPLIKEWLTTPQHYQFVIDSFVL